MLVELSFCEITDGIKHLIPTLNAFKSATTLACSEAGALADADLKFGSCLLLLHAAMQLSIMRPQLKRSEALGDEPFLLCC